MPTAWTGGGETTTTLERSARPYSAGMDPDPSALSDRGFDGLRSDRVLVRRFRDADATSLAAYRSDPEVARHQGWSTPMSVAQAQRFIGSLAGDHPDTPGSWFQFAVESLQSGAHIGDVAAFTDRDDPRVATVGVTLSRDAQGAGYATEALGLLLDYLLAHRGKHRVVADCDPRNLAVVRLLERLGMRREGHHLESYWDGDSWTDEYVYAILAREWQQTSHG
jgi:aminoglycoside 6'-N-acetyltransferase